MVFTVGFFLRRKLVIAALAIFLGLLVFTGCSGVSSRETSVDRYEKWRVLAEESRGHTPSSKKYETGIMTQRTEGGALVVEEDDPKEDGLKKDKRREDKRREDKPKETGVKENGVKEGEFKEPGPVETDKEISLPSMRVTMKMHEVPVAVLLRTLARVADVNIMINETVAGNAKINIRDLPWNQAFLTVLDTYSLSYSWKNDVLRVVTVEDLTKDIALLEAQHRFEKLRKEHRISMMAMETKQEKLEPLLTRIVRVDYSDMDLLKKNLEDYLLANLQVDDSIDTTGVDNRERRRDVKFRGSILVDRGSSSMILQATESDLAKIIPIIREIDQPTEQVLIECHIVEANSDTAKELGVQWGGLALNTSGGYRNMIGGPIFDSSGNPDIENDSLSKRPNAGDGDSLIHSPGLGSIVDFPSKSAAEGRGFSLGLLHENIGKNILYAQLSALQEEGKLNILSKPSITTMDNRLAIIKSGKEVPYQTVEDGTTNIEFKEATISLEVTPHVIDGEVLRLLIKTKKDELDWTHTVEGNPTIIKKEAETEVTLFNGQTTVIGGLNKEKISESESGVPWLKDIKGLGWLFKNNNNSANMEELLIFITPHLLKEKPGEAVKE